MDLGKVARKTEKRTRLTLFPMLLICVMIAGCTLLNGLPNPTATGERDGDTLSEDESANSTPARGSRRWSDASDVMTGICFEAANDAAGRIFVIRDSAELDAFFGLADNSQLCRRPVKRGTFDFANGRVLAGVWSAGRGCKARHDVDSFERNNEAKTIAIDLTLVVEGDCPYELVRPFWISIPNAQEHDIAITVRDAAGE